MDVLFQKQAEFILSRGTGIKACLFDEESKRAVGNVIPYSIFQDRDFFYFDYLRRRDRVPLSDVSCVVVIRAESLKSLIEELASPCYGRYVVLFTHRIDPFVLEILAGADTRGVVSEVHEIYLDVVRESTGLYTTRSTAYPRVLDGLHGLLMTLEIAPRIRVHVSGTDACAGDRSLSVLGRELRTRAREHCLRRAGTVVLLRRNFDLVTPLLHDWHYQALIGACLGNASGTVQLDGRELSLDDAFFEENKFRDIGAVGDSIRALAAEISRGRSHELEDIEERVAHTRSVETHLRVYNAVLASAVAQKELSEAELSLVRSGSVDEASLLAGRDDDAGLRLLLLARVLRGGDWVSESTAHPQHSPALQRFAERFSPAPFPYRPSFNTACDLKLGYEPPLRRMLRHVAADRVLPSVLQDVSDDGTQPGPIIFYIEGGVTLCEYRSVMQHAAELKVDAYIVSDRIVSHVDIIREITQ